RKFPFRSLIENETFARGGNANHQAAGLSAQDQIVFVVDRNRARVRLFGPEEHLTLTVRRDTMDLTLIASSYEQVAFAIENHSPDIFGLRIVHHFKLPVSAD